MRLMLFALCLAVLGAPLGAQDLRSAFYAMPRADRMELQEHLARTGLYTGTIDGLWGPGTAGAFQQARQSLAWPGYQELVTSAGATDEVEALWAYVSDPDMAASLPDWRQD